MSTGSPDPAAGDLSALSEDHTTTALDVYERALGMVTLAVDGLRGNTSGHFEQALAIVMPLLGYAFETVAKVTWALHRLESTGALPDGKQVKDAGTYRGGETPFPAELPPDFKHMTSFPGHAVSRIIDDLASRQGSANAATLREMVRKPLSRLCVDAITAFHAFTRYALLDEFLAPDNTLLEPDQNQADSDERPTVEGREPGPKRLLAGEVERRFAGIVYELDRLVTSGYDKRAERSPAEFAEYHRSQFPVVIAAAYWELFVALSDALADALRRSDDSHALGGQWCAERVRIGLETQVEDWVDQGWLAPVDALSGG